MRRVVGQVSHWHSSSPICQQVSRVVTLVMLRGSTGAEAGTHEFPCRTFSRTARTNIHSSRAASCGASFFFGITQHTFATAIQLIRSPRERGNARQRRTADGTWKKRNTSGLSCAKHAHTHISGEQCFRKCRVFGFDFGWSEMFSQGKRVRPILQNTRCEGWRQIPRMRFAAIADTRKKTRNQSRTLQAFSKVVASRQRC